MALVAHHLLVGAAEAVGAAAGAAGVAGGLRGAVRPPPTQTQAAPEARWEMKLTLTFEKRSGECVTIEGNCA